MNKIALRNATLQTNQIITDHLGEIEVRVYLGRAEADYSDLIFNGNFSDFDFRLKAYRYECTMEQAGESDLLETITGYGSEIEEIYKPDWFGDDNLIIRINGFDIMLTIDDCFMYMDSYTGDIKTMTRAEYERDLQWGEDYCQKMANPGLAG